MGDYFIDQSHALYAVLMKKPVVGPEPPTFDKYSRQKKLEELYKAKKIKFIPFLDRSAHIAPFDVLNMNESTRTRPSESCNYFSDDTRARRHESYECKICYQPMQVRVRWRPCKHVTCWLCYQRLRKDAQEAHRAATCGFCRETVLGHDFPSDEERGGVNSSDDDPEDYADFPALTSGDAELFDLTPNSDSDFVTEDEL